MSTVSSKRNAVRAGLGLGLVALVSCGAVEAADLAAPFRSEAAAVGQLMRTSSSEPGSSVTASESHEPLRLCTGELSGRRAVGREVVRVCVIDEGDAVKISLSERLDQPGPQRGAVVSSELPDPVERRVDDDGRLHYVVTVDLQAEHGHHDALGHLADDYAAVRWDLRLSQRHTIHDEGILAQHYVGTMTRSEQRRGSTEFGPAHVIDGLHFYSIEHDPNIAWGYGGEVGPDHWGLLEAADEACLLDRPDAKQSPVFLADEQTSACESGKGLTSIHYRKSRMSRLNNGHTLGAGLLAPGEVLDPDRGSYIEADGKRYWLLHVHVHTPSEHMLASAPEQEYPLEFHFVHKAWDGELAVLGVFADADALPGETPAAELVAQLLADFPTERNVAKEFDGLVDPEQLLPASGRREVYAYEGSLTTPPCSEGVRWFVMRNPISVTAAELSQIRELVGGPNARRHPELDPPVPSLGSRQVRRCPGPA